MSEPFDIRPARPLDEGAVRGCAEEAYAQYVAAIGRKPAPMVADFAGLIASGHVYVAVDAEDRVLGFVVFFKKGRDVFLENIAVQPEAAGRGIGKRLIAFCEAYAIGAKAQTVQLYTNAKMTANLSLYPHLGYRETGRRHEEGFDRVYFEKRI